jgi:hypothetical protein
VLEGADHGFAARKASGRNKDDVWREAVDAMLRGSSACDDGPTS